VSDLSLRCRRQNWLGELLSLAEPLRKFYPAYFSLSLIFFPTGPIEVSSNDELNLYRLSLLNYNRPRVDNIQNMIWDYVCKLVEPVKREPV
jgi:hypothetical protein